MRKPCSVLQTDNVLRDYPIHNIQFVFKDAKMNDKKCLSVKELSNSNVTLNNNLFLFVFFFVPSRFLYLLWRGCLQSAVSTTADANNKILLNSI